MLFHSQRTFHLKLLCIFPWIFYSLFKPMSLFHVGKHQWGKDQFSLFCLVPLLFPFQINVKGEVDNFSLVGKCLFRKDHFFFWHLTLLFPLNTNVQKEVGHFPLVGKQSSIFLSILVKKSLKRITKIFPSCHKENLLGTPCDPMFCLHE